MENVFKINGARTHSSTTMRSLHDPIAVNGEDWQTVVYAPATEQPARGTRLPPTRAARTPRSRGVFLAAVEPSRGGRARRWADLSIAALAVAVVAVSSALIMGAPATMMGVALNLNPGPAIIGAASVPPSFMEPSKGH
jgi:hypothetical protein